jgi:hypothetical protein
MWRASATDLAMTWALPLSMLRLPLPPALSQLLVGRSGSASESAGSVEKRNSRRVSRAMACMVAVA